MENEEAVYELIEKYDYSELNEAQKILVLSEMTVEEYGEMRKAVTLTANFFDNEPILMGEDLIIPIVKQENILVKIINYKLPIYKIAAILLIVLCIDRFIPEESNKEVGFAEKINDTAGDSTAFLAYNIYSSKNSIKYDTGLSRVY